MAKAKQRVKSGPQVTQWLATYRRTRALLLGLGSIGTLLLSIPVLYVTWWVIWLVLFLPALSLANVSLNSLSIVTWTVFGLLFIAHVTTDRRYLDSLKFDEESPGVVAAQLVADVAGMSSLALFIAGPNTMRSQVKVAGLILLTGPSLVGHSWRLIRAAGSALRLDVATVADALTLLLEAGKRVLVDDLVKKVRPLSARRLLRELLLIDGVILLTSGDPALTLTDSLREELAGALQNP